MTEYSAKQGHIELPAVPLTLDGSYILHQMFRIRWPEWRALCAADQREIVEEASRCSCAMEANRQEPTALFSMIGHKSDLMLVHFRKSLEELNGAELGVAQWRLCDYLESTTSYVSVVELGLYEATVKLYG